MKSRKITLLALVFCTVANAELGHDSQRDFLDAMERIRAANEMPEVGRGFDRSSRQEYVVPTPTTAAALLKQELERAKADGLSFDRIQLQTFSFALDFAKRNLPEYEKHLKGMRKAPFQSHYSFLASKHMWERSIVEMKEILEAEETYRNLTAEVLRLMNDERVQNSPALKKRVEELAKALQDSDDPSSAYLKEDERKALGKRRLMLGLAAMDEEVKKIAADTSPRLPPLGSVRNKPEASDPLRDMIMPLTIPRGTEEKLPLQAPPSFTQPQIPQFIPPGPQPQIAKPQSRLDGLPNPPKPPMPGEYYGPDLLRRMRSGSAGALMGKPPSSGRLRLGSDRGL